MADDYTPSTGEVRRRYAYARSGKPRHRNQSAVAEFDRWLAGVIAEKRAEWEDEQGTEEPEWEYGVRDGYSGNVISVGAPWMDREFAEKVTANDSDSHGIRRRKAGPWVPVDDNGESK